jgi:hypothetical protein
MPKLDRAPQHRGGETIGGRETPCHNYSDPIGGRAMKQPDINVRFDTSGHVGFDLLTDGGRRWFAKMLKAGGTPTVWLDVYDPAARRIEDLMRAEGTDARRRA